MIDKNKSSKKPKSSPPTGNTNSLRLHNPGPLRSSNALRGEAWGAGGSRGAARHAAPSCRPGLPTQDAAREGPPRVAICPKEALECPRGEMTRDSTTPTPQKGQKGESRAPSKGRKGTNAQALGAAPRRPRKDSSASRHHELAQTARSWVRPPRAWLPRTAHARGRPAESPPPAGREIGRQRAELLPTRPRLPRSLAEKLKVGGKVICLKVLGFIH